MHRFAALKAQLIRKGFVVVGHGCAVTPVKCAFAESPGCLSALQHSVAFLFGQGSCATASLQRRHRHKHWFAASLNPHPTAAAFEQVFMSPYVLHVIEMLLR